MRKLLTLALVALLALAVAAPVQARWGTRSVETWAVYGSRTVGKGVQGGTMSIQMQRGQTISLLWTIRNGGGQPSEFPLWFDGCGYHNGFHVKYFTAGGADVTYKVTHDGFASAVVGKGETVTLVVRITADRVASRSCALHAPAHTRDDVVHLNIRSL